MTTEKQLWVLAGGNGAGKSTFYQQFLAPLGVQFVNADVIALNLDSQNQETVSYAAAKIAERLRYDMLHAGISFCFETVFSHPSKIDFIADAKALGYEIVLVFIHLQMNELNQARVAQRVSEGGHNVPVEKIISRIPRALQHIQISLPLADKAQLYDNSSAQLPFQLIARMEKGVLIQSADPLPGWAREMLREYLDAFESSHV